MVYFQGETAYSRTSGVQWESMEYNVSTRNTMEVHRMRYDMRSIIVEKAKLKFL